MKKRIISLIVLWFLAGTVVAQSFMPPELDVVDFTLSLDRPTARPGETITLQAEVNIKPGFHIYSVHPEMSLSPTQIHYADSSFFDAIGIITEPDPHMAYDPNFNQVVGTHVGQLTLSQSLVLSRSVTPGRYTLEGEINYLACDATRCIPHWDPFAVELDVIAGEPRVEYLVPVETEYPSAVFRETGTESASSASETLDRAIDEGLFSFLLLAFSMGLLALLTPCVFPMIPITVSYFTKQGESGAGKPVRSATIYALGIIIIFTLLGLALAVTLGASGANRLAASPWINLFIALFFIIFSFISQYPF